MLAFIALWLSTAAIAAAGTSKYKIELSWGKGAPDGHEREMIFINGQYPGPLLDIQQGDWVEIEVTNWLPFNTTIHYHGIDQMNTPWADGVPGLTQRPIQTGATFKYKWHANSYGSYFYHAHTRGQIDDGAYGPIVIRPQPGIPKPFDMICDAEPEDLEDAEANVQSVLLTDWRHRTSDLTWSDQVASGFESAVCMDSLLVNGKGAVDCWAQDDIDASVDQNILPLMNRNGLKLTKKGCVPPDFFRATLGNNTKINAAALPSEVFDICTPTEGSREVFKAPRDKKWLALDVISTAGIDTFSFSVDEHPMWVYAVDAHYIEPLEVDVLTVANGDRYSVFIQLNKEGGNYAIRVASKAATQVIDTFAVLAYEDKNPSHACGNTTHVEVVSSIPSIDRIGEPWGPNVTVFNQAEMKSFPPQFPQPAPAADQTFFMHMGTIKNSFTWALNSTPLYHSMLDDRHQPLLWEPPARTISGEGNIVTKNNTWIDLVFISHQPLAPPHPIHKHSNKAFILGTGTGFFMWKSVAEAVEEIPQNFNLVDPPFRDGFVVPPSRFEPVWLAVRYQVVNPGAFMLHCHIQSHLNGGMAMVMLDGVDKWPTVPEDCKN